jgi:hypothetical protein
LAGHYLTVRTSRNCDTDCGGWGVTHCAALDAALCSQTLGQRDRALMEPHPGTMFATSGVSMARSVKSVCISMRVRS